MAGDETHEPKLARADGDPRVYVACTCGKWAAPHSFSSYHDALEEFGAHRRFPNRHQVEQVVNQAAATWVESVQRALAKHASATT